MLPLHQLGFVAKNCKIRSTGPESSGSDFYALLRATAHKRVVVLGFVCRFDLVVVIRGQLSIFVNAKTLLSCLDTLPILLNAANHVVYMVYNRMIASKCLSEVK